MALRRHDREGRGVIFEPLFRWLQDGQPDNDEASRNHYSAATWWLIWWGTGHWHPCCYCGEGHEDRLLRWGSDSIILMSVRPGAPYADRVEDEGKILIYEGHDCARTVNGPDPKRTDQPEHYPGGSLTENGLFARAARRYKDTGEPAELVRVYEKIRSGIWVYNGLFELIDCWTEESAGRRVSSSNSGLQERMVSIVQV